MKKNICIYLLIVFIFLNSSKLFSCSKKWKTIKDINLSECILINNNDSKLTVQQYNLKNEYTLYLRPVIKKIKGEEYYETEIYLQKNNKLKLIISNQDGGYNFNKDLFYYENIDFDKYFCLSLTQDTKYYYLINKEKGQINLISFAGSVDIENNIFIYVKIENNDEKMILYDLSNEKQYDLDMFVNYGTQGSNTYWEDFKIDFVTNDYYKITYSGSYDNNGNPILQTFILPKN